MSIQENVTQLPGPEIIILLKAAVQRVTVFIVLALDLSVFTYAGLVQKMRSMRDGICTTLNF